MTRGRVLAAVAGALAAIAATSPPAGIVFSDEIGRAHV